MEYPIFYDEAEAWSNAILLYDAALKEINTKIEILNNEFKLAHQYNPIEHITSRIKSPQSIAKKMRHNERELTVENIVKYINDVAGIRVICSFTSDIYRIADAIAKQSDVKVLKIKDYIMCPKENGYMSYHMIVSVPIYLTDKVVDTKVEIQIRTIAMDFWASLEHKIYYKFEGNAPAHIRKELKECSDIVSYLDQKMLSLNEEIKSYNNSIEEEYRQEAVKEYQEMMKDAFGTIVDDECTVDDDFDVDDDSIQSCEVKDDVRLKVKQQGIDIVIENALIEDKTVEQNIIEDIEEKSIEDSLINTSQQKVTKRFLFPKKEKA